MATTCLCLLYVITFARLEDLSVTHKRQGLERPLSPFRSLKNGGSHLTLADIEDMNRHLLPSLQGELQIAAANLINFGWDSLHDGTRWFFKRDAQGRIKAAVLNDLRDHYTRCFCQPEELDALLAEAIDCASEMIHMGAQPEAQWPIIEAFFLRHDYTASYGTEPYSIVLLTDYHKFNEAYQSLQKLPPHFVIDRLRFPEDAEFIDRSWTYHGPTSYPPIGESIYSRPSICLRDPGHVGLKNMPSVSLPLDLAGWELCRSDGSLGSLRVSEPYRNQGLGKWLSAELAKKVLLLDPIPEIAHVALYPRIQPLAYIDPENEASFKVHDALGFTRGQQFGWSKWHPKSANKPSCADQSC